MGPFQLPISCAQVMKDCKAACTVMEKDQLERGSFSGYSSWKWNHLSMTVSQCEHNRGRFTQPMVLASTTKDIGCKLFAQHTLKCAKGSTHIKVTMTPTGALCNGVRHSPSQQAQSMRLPAAMLVRTQGSHKMASRSFSEDWRNQYRSKVLLLTLMETYKLIDYKHSNTSHQVNLSMNLLASSATVDEPSKDVSELPLVPLAVSGFEEIGWQAIVLHIFVAVRAWNQHWGAIAGVSQCDCRGILDRGRKPLLRRQSFRNSGMLLHPNNQVCLADDFVNAFWPWLECFGKLHCWRCLSLHSTQTGRW